MSASDQGRVEAKQRDLMGRRKFMATTAAATATLALGAGSAAAVSGLNFGGPVPNPTLVDTVTIAEHNREDMTSVLEWIDDSDQVATLADDGAKLDTGDDDSDSPVNPVTLRADRIDAYDMYDFPKGETYEDADGDEQDLNALERPDDWTASSASILVEESEAASGAPALRFAGDGIADGGTESATFGVEEPISDGLRKYGQVGVNVNALPAGTSAIVRVTDDSTASTVDLRIDPSADPADADVIATETTTGTIYQTQFGELVDTLDQIDSVEVEVNDGDVDLEVFALNVERSSRWEFGTREYTNDDDNLDTETVYEPNGEYSVLDLDTLGDVFGSATIVDVMVDLELETAGVADDDVVEYEFNDLDHPSYNREMRLVVNRELPTGYDLTWSDPTLVDTGKLFGEQYATLDLDTDRDDAVALEDVGDTDMVDRSDAPGDRGDEYELAASTSPGLTQTVYYRLRIDGSTESDMQADGAAGRSGASGGGGFFSSARGMVLGAGAGVAAFFAMFRSRIFG